MTSPGWPAELLGDAITELARRSGIAAPTGGVPNPKAQAVADPARAGVWIERAARFLGCEAEAIATTFADLERDLSAAHPGILQMPDGAWLAILRSTRRSFVVAAPVGRLQRIGKDQVCRMLRESSRRAHGAEVEQLLADAGIAAARREKAARIILSEQMAATRFAQCWMIRVPPGATMSRWLGQAGAIRNAGLLIFAHTAQYLLWIGAFWLIGRSALTGRMDPGMFYAWALLLITLIPLRLFTTWMQGILGIGIGGLLKQRLLSGALRLNPEEVRHQGIGHFLGQVLEAEAVETLTLSGGIAAVLSLIELLVAAVILGRSSVLLLAWCGAALLLAWKFVKRYEIWTASRRAMTHDLVENMVGQRTRLVQQPRDEWHVAEDQSVDGYLDASRSLDRYGALLVAAIPRGWLLVGLAGLIPGFVANDNSVASIAVRLGGVLLAYGALGRLTGSLVDIAGAWIAWKQVAPLFHAAARSEAAGEILSSPAQPRANRPRVIQADRLTFRYDESRSPVLQGCSLEIASGDRILLEGPSGGGKSTFASLLSGIRQPDTGMLLAGGLDLHTRGADRWRKQVAMAPQFHENHIFTETLCFNLLMGRCWPPAPTDVEDAESICRQLGLGNLLENMPGGILQMVGEGGWQLSHGEKSRIFTARALLQGAEMVILDESLAALDPENLGVALECAMKTAETLLVIAHP